jgi:hypothetical protein
MWDLWDATPVRIHGFMTPALSEQILRRRMNVQGAFLLRFSSKGGLAVDYVRGNKVDKTHWKSSDLENSTRLKAKLYDKNRDGPFLLELVDSRQDPLQSSFTIPKADIFPVNALDNGSSVSSNHVTCEEPPVNKHLNSIVWLRNRLHQHGGVGIRIRQRRR